MDGPFILMHLFSTHYENQQAHSLEDSTMNKLAYIAAWTASDKSSRSLNEQPYVMIWLPSADFE